MTNHVICDVIFLNFTNFTKSSPFWTTQLDFFETYIGCQVVESDQRNDLEKYFFNTMSRFWLMTSFVTSLCLILLILPLHRLFGTTQLDLYEIFIRSKVVLHDQKNILVKYWFDTMSRIWPMTYFMTSFCYILLILPLHHL